MNQEHLVDRLREMEKATLVIKQELEDFYTSKRYNAVFERMLLRLQQLKDVIVETEVLVKRDGVQP